MTTYEFTIQFRNQKNIFIEVDADDQFEALAKAEQMAKEQYPDHLCVVPEDPTKDWHGMTCEELENA